MTASTTPGSGRDDRVLPLTRWVSLAIIPFLVVAFAVLYPFPDDTGRLFAWPVKPAITPMILASVYLGGAYFFLRAAQQPGMAHRQGRLHPGRDLRHLDGGGDDPALG